MMCRIFIVRIAIIGLFGLSAFYVTAQSQAPAFMGEKTDWHGFARYDFVMDELTFAVTSIKAPEGEKYSVGTPPKGQRRCIIVAPAKAAAGKTFWEG